MRINLDDHFPIEGLNNYLIGRDFIRISPLTGAKIKGTVKSVRVVYDGNIMGDTYRPVINVTSTNDVTYDYNELFFNVKQTIEKRAKALAKIQEDEEIIKLKNIGDI
jgi:hypothetical protein